MGSVARLPERPRSRGGDFFLRTLQRCMVTDAEGELLADAAGVMDLIVKLEADVLEGGPLTDDGKVRPAMVELRQQRLLLSKLLRQLDLAEPDADEDEEPVRPSTVRGRKAALSRWDRPGARRDPR